MTTDPKTAFGMALDALERGLLQFDVAIGELDKQRAEYVLQRDNAFRLLVEAREKLGIKTVTQ
jgi:hypothetical protein